ncbi:MAG: permease-like cell division protein FtsX [Gammaproteobacteria bacterium]|nr:permease-like cell division protein FtsX [Gammaproteobacteria bacterium]MBU4020753.1 permease-like cell division protein FtsX [Gammaproteobacteria bacterium]MBU4147232.1 permease-like cell division protein FtsX [Gammaproteobacteria bacterium]
MNWLFAHWNACRRALARLAAAPLNTLLALLGIGVALALPAGGHLLLTHLSALTRSASPTPQVTVFLAVDAERKLSQGVELRLQGLSGVAKTQMLAREDTLTRMKATEGLADAIAALPKNPFPDAIVVTPADDSPAAIERLATIVRQWRDVEHVQIDADWARRLHALVRLANTGVLLLATLLGIGLVTITFNTIRLQVLSRQSEVEVSRLLGATDAFIRRPFLWYGGMLGLLGGAMAWLIVSAATLWLRLPVAEIARLYGLDLMLTLPTAAESAVLLGGAALLGWLGAALSMRQH